MRASRFYQLVKDGADLGAQFFHEGILNDLFAGGENKFEIGALDDVQARIIGSVEFLAQARQAAI